MVTVKYHAFGNFDIDTEINVDSTDDLNIWIAIMSNLESRYGLEVSFERGNTENG